MLVKYQRPQKFIIMNLNFFGDCKAAKILLGNDVMAVHNVLADMGDLMSADNIDNALVDKSLDDTVDLFAGLLPSWTSEILSAHGIISLTFSQKAWESAKKVLPNPKKLLKLPGGVRRVSYTAFLFGNRIGSFIAKKVNPFFAVKGAWDFGTYIGCLANCTK